MVVCALTGTHPFEVYTYVNGELKRTYQASLEQAEEAVEATLDDLKLPIPKKSATGLKTTFHAGGPKDTPVTVRAALKGAKVTEISVRSGMIGLWNRKYSQEIHDKIAVRLLASCP